MDRIVMHIDVNNAFLSWTAVYLLKSGSKYDIRNSYAVIGGDENSRKGIVLAKSNPAKKLGIVTGETLYSARKKCKALKSYPMYREFYSEMSNKMFNLIRSYSPDIEVASIDECYLEYTKVRNLYGDPYEFAKKLQKEIYDSFGFTVNIGIANNKLCAKMASDFTKPNKIHILYDYEVKEKMWPLPINDLFGIGKKTTEKLLQLNVKTIGDLAQFDRNILYKYFKNMAGPMIDSANGINNDLVISEEVENKGLSNEITLIKDVSSKKELYPYLLKLSEKVGLRVRKLDKYAYTVAVIIKDSSFKRRTHQKKLVNPTNLTNEIYDKSIEILNEMWNDEPVRLIGLRLDNLVNNISYQTSLFEDVKIRESNTELEKTVDKLKEKFGDKIIKRIDK